MKELIGKICESIEKTIRIIAVLTFFCGLIASIIFIWKAFDYLDNVYFITAISIIFGSFIISMLMLGFSVIIEKLKESTNNQSEIIKLLNKEVNNDVDKDTEKDANKDTDEYNA